MQKTGNIARDELIRFIEEDLDDWVDIRDEEEPIEIFEEKYPRP